MGFQVAKSTYSRPSRLFSHFRFGVIVAGGSKRAAGMGCFSNSSNGTGTAKVTPIGRWSNLTARIGARGIAWPRIGANSREASGAAEPSRAGWVPQVLRTWRSDFEGRGKVDRHRGHYLFDQRSSHLPRSQSPFPPPFRRFRFDVFTFGRFLPAHPSR